MARARNQPIGTGVTAIRGDAYGECWGSVRYKQAEAVRLARHWWCVRVCSWAGCNSTDCKDMWTWELARVQRPCVPDSLA